MTEQLDPIVKHALTELFSPTGRFSICAFNDICKMLNVIPPPGVYERLHLMHCVSYRDMPEDVRQEVGRLVYRTLNTPGFSIQIDQAVELAKGKVRKLIAGE